MNDDDFRTQRERESKVKVKGIMPKLIKNIVAQNNKTREWPFALLRASDIIY